MGSDLSFNCCIFPFFPDSDFFGLVDIKKPPGYLAFFNGLFELLLLRTELAVTTFHFQKDDLPYVIFRSAIEDDEVYWSANEFHIRRPEREFWKIGAYLLPQLAEQCPLRPFRSEERRVGKECRSR